jgi:CheY-like chemotaxis protein
MLRRSLETQLRRVVKVFYRLGFGAPRSAVEIAASLLPYKQAKAVCATTRDPVEILREFAKLLSLSELDIMQKLAERLKLECISKIPVIDPDHLPSGITMQLLRDCAATLVRSSDGCLRVVCVEPALVQERIFERELLSEATPIALAPWHSIEQAIIESEQIRDQRQALRLAEDLKNSKSLAYRVIPVIISEAEKFNQKEVVLTLQQQDSNYSFKTSDGRTGVGALHLKVREALRIVLVERADPLDGLTRVDGTLIDRIRYKTIVDKGAHKITLTWSKASNAAASRGDLRKNNQQREVSFDKGFHDKVLIVDDNPTFAKVLSRYLSKEKIEATYAKNGEVGLEVLQRTVVLPTVIICDVHMPGMNGFEFIAKLKSDKRFARIPTIMLTSDSDTDTKVSLLTAGVDAFVNKAEDPRVLLVHVTKLIERAKKEAA